MIAFPVVQVSADVDHLPALWAAYQVLRDSASQLWERWRMMKHIARTDGTAGFLYGQAYEAEHAADQAYEAYLAAKRDRYGDRG